MPGFSPQKLAERACWCYSKLVDRIRRFSVAGPLTKGVEQGGKRTCMQELQVPFRAVSLSWLERLLHTQEVAGSNPAPPTNTARMANCALCAPSALLGLPLVGDEFQQKCTFLLSCKA